MSSARVVAHAFWALQWQLMGRGGDIFKLKRSELSVHPHFYYVMTAKITDSKNINAANGSREQIVLPSADVLLCPHFGMARYFAWLLEGHARLSLQQLTAMLPPQRLWMKLDEAGLIIPLSKDDAGSRFDAVHSSSSYEQRQVS